MREAASLSLSYRGYELLAPPPPTQGVSTLAIMGVLGYFDLPAHGAGSANHIHLCVEAVKRAFLTRDDIADPDFVPQPV
jgi:gamma-glutamyltranspeptidase/glutathione hydrolase